MILCCFGSVPWSYRHFNRWGSKVVAAGGHGEGSFLQEAPSLLLRVPPFQSLLHPLFCFPSHFASPTLSLPLTPSEFCMKLLLARDGHFPLSLYVVSPALDASLACVCRPTFSCWPAPSAWIALLLSLHSRQQLKSSRDWNFLWRVLREQIETLYD